LRKHSVGDVNVSTNKANRASVRATFYLGNHPDPANLAVVGPYDSVLSGVVFVVTRYRGPKLLFGPFAIFGMNTLDPILMSLIRGLRWQSVDQKVFWGAAISKSIPKLDLDATNPTNALNECQLAFPVPQCAIRFVSFALNLLEVPPQTLGSLGSARKI
jgi:hypothetical protein